MALDTLTLFVPYELDSRGKCCTSRVVVAHAHERTRIRNYFQKKMEEAVEPFGIVAVEYTWQGKWYACTSSQAIVSGIDENYDETFDAFAETIHYYPRLDERGLPFPGDEPNLHYPEPSTWLERGPRRPSPKQRHRRQPRIASPKAPRGAMFDITKQVFGNPLRVQRSDVRQPSPLYPSRTKREMSYPPKGCHPFVKTRIITDDAKKKIPQSIQTKAFHSYDLCEFGDVPRAMREANFKAIRRRKGTVTAFYNFYRVPFAVVTDMSERVAIMMLRSEL